VNSAIGEGVAHLAPFVSVFAFTIGLPAIMATYYQSFKARQEARRAREGSLHSRDCLEFVSGDGVCINLVPLESLPALPHVGEVILLPGHGTGVDGEFVTGAYLVERVEQFYTRTERKGSRPNEARLTKTVATVTSLNPAITT
jgi:hypothetical protein